MPNQPCISRRESRVHLCTGSRKALQLESRSLPRSIFYLTVDVDPAAESARHRRDFLISHLLHRESRQRGAVAAGAVNDHTLFPVHERLDLRLEISAWKVHRPGDTSEIPFIWLPHIEINRFLAASDHRLYIFRRNFLDLLLRLGDQVLARLVCHDQAM